jgi:hypothetical protein
MAGRGKACSRKAHMRTNGNKGGTVVYVYSNICTYDDFGRRVGGGPDQVNKQNTTNTNNIKTNSNKTTGVCVCLYCITSFRSGQL